MELLEEESFTEQKLPRKEKSASEILELASAWDTSLKGYGRNEDGTLRDWCSWSTSHPQSLVDVKICNGRKEWCKETIRANEREIHPTFSVVSWNLLSDTWFRFEQHKTYSHVRDQDGDWNVRFPRMLKDWLTVLEADVLALQEVDYERFEFDLYPVLRDAGYEGLMQSPKKRNPNQPCGVATFWRSDTFQSYDSAMFSRSMVVSLKSKAVAPVVFSICVANVHLEASQTVEGADKRARQLNSALAWADKITSSATVVCGDFNTGADAGLFRALRDYRWHGHALASAYEHRNAHRTLPVCRGTYAVPERHYVIDHVLYSHETLRLRRLLNAFDPAETLECLGPLGTFEKGLPNSTCPSDHVPVGASFEVRVDISRERKENLSQITIGDESSSIDVNISTERRKEMEEELKTILIAKPPPLPRGKPSKEEILSRQEFAALLRKWRNSYQENPFEFKFASDLLRKYKK